jgi:CDP-2,3-bis-(O-geranylgeranyl)-sn-glycerol synthase
VDIHLLVISQMVALLTVANGAPVIATKVMGQRWSLPLDRGAPFVDGKPLLGKSKTIRGIVLAILLSALAAGALGLDWAIGAVAGSAAMAGDLFSSFVKRRLSLAPSSRATGLDQIPESLFPLLACQHVLSLSVLDIVICVAIFFAGEIMLSRLLYKAHIRDRPY